MTLYIIATPIGHIDDLTLRAKAILEKVPVVIGEEFRELSTFLKRIGITGKTMELLNEHSTPGDVERLVHIVTSQECALVSDCGTPVFCDPGSELVRLCRAKGIKIVPLPGPSSLMTLLSTSSQRLDSFVFLGFLPREENPRQIAIAEIRRERRAVILMDTPYRLGKLLSELSQLFPDRKALLGINLTQPDERILEGTLKILTQKTADQKAEFVLLIYAEPAEEKQISGRSPGNDGAQANGRSQSAAELGRRNDRKPFKKR